jgi:cell division septal protein FtsQ
MKGGPAMTDYALPDRDYRLPEGQSHERGSRARDNAGSRAGAARGYNSPRAAGKGGSLTIVIGATLTLSLAIAGAVGLALPLSAVTRAELARPGDLSGEELLAWTGVASGANWFTLDEAALAANLASHPRIAKARVKKLFPNALYFDLTERSPVALIYARAAGGRLEAHCVDAEGVLFAPAGELSGASELPVISGVEIRGLRYGMRLGAPFPQLLASIAELKASDPGLLSAVSEIRMVAREGSLPEALLYPSNYRMPVRIKPVLNAELLKSMMLVLDVMYARGLAPNVLELDFRSDTYVYTLKEAVSG